MAVIDWSNWMDGAIGWSKEHREKDIFFLQQKDSRNRTAK